MVKDKTGGCVVDKVSKASLQGTVYIHPPKRPVHTCTAASTSKSSLQSVLRCQARKQAQHERKHSRRVQHLSCTVVQARPSAIRQLQRVGGQHSPGGPCSSCRRGL